MTARTNGQYRYKLTGADFHPGRRQSQHRRYRGRLLLCGVIAIPGILWLLLC